MENYLNMTGKSVWIVQEFYLNDGTVKRALVTNQQSKKYECGLVIQISEVVDHYIDMVPQYRYIYEEIDSNDIPQYARYMGLDNIIRNYEWFKPSENVVTKEVLFA